MSKEIHATGYTTPSSTPAEAGSSLDIGARPHAGAKVLKMPWAAIWAVDKDEAYLRLFPCYETMGFKPNGFSYVENHKIKFAFLYELRMAGYTRLRLELKDGVILAEWNPGKVCWDCVEIVQGLKFLQVSKEA